MFCGDYYHGLGTRNYYADSDLIDWVNTVNDQGGVVTMDWPFIPETGNLKDFGAAIMVRLASFRRSWLREYLSSSGCRFRRGLRRAEGPHHSRRSLTVVLGR